MKLPDPIQPIEAQDDDVLLAMCVFGEARGQCDAAKQGVANVVRTRTLDPRRRYGYGWSGVILKRWQFSSFNLADPNRRKLLRPFEHEKPEVWTACWEIARKVFASIEPDNTQGATHYFDDSLAANPPRWAALFVPTVKLGSLNFFREGGSS